MMKRRHTFKTLAAGALAMLTGRAVAKSNTDLCCELEQIRSFPMLIRDQHLLEFARRFARISETSDTEVFVHWHESRTLLGFIGGGKSVAIAREISRDEIFDALPQTLARIAAKHDSLTGGSDSEPVSYPLSEEDQKLLYFAKWLAKFAAEKDVSVRIGSWEGTPTRFMTISSEQGFDDRGGPWRRSTNTRDGESIPSALQRVCSPVTWE